MTPHRHAFDAMRAEVARETRVVCEFSDGCRFWVAHAGTNAPASGEAVPR